MAYCPSCGCRTAEAARFCPMCGVMINQDAVNARLSQDDGVPRRAEVPQPNERLIEGYTTPGSHGLSTARAMRVVSVLLAILLAVAGIAGGVMLLSSGSVAGGILMIVLGIIAALLIYFLLHIGIVAFENISVIARGVETQHRISTAQLEVLSHMALLQDESLRLNRQTVELLKVIDGDRFDAAKQAECQTALLDKLTEQQREQAQRLSELRSSGEAVLQLARPLAQSLQSWKTESHRFIHGVALAISQLPERLRDVLTGEQPAKAEDTAQTTDELPAAADGVPAAEESAADVPEDNAASDRSEAE